MKRLTWMLRGFATAALIAAVSTSAFSARTIRFIVPVPAGASTDFIARLMASHVGATEGVTAIVENRPGAAGMIGTEYVSRQPPDGNTVLITPGSYLIDVQIRKAAQARIELTVSAVVLFALDDVGKVREAEVAHGHHAQLQPRDTAQGCATGIDEIRKAGHGRAR